MKRKRESDAGSIPNHSLTGMQQGTLVPGRPPAKKYCLRDVLTSNPPDGRSRPHKNVSPQPKGNFTEHKN